MLDPRHCKVYGDAVNPSVLSFDEKILLNGWLRPHVLYNVEGQSGSSFVCCGQSIRSLVKYNGSRCLRLFYC
jgi:hypothetical protein